MEITENLIAYWIEKGPRQNIENGFYNSLRLYNENDAVKERYLTLNAFKRCLPNGEKVDRTWLIYSPLQGKVYCFACRLFSTSDSPFSKSGFNDWKHVHELLREHENSLDHRKSMLVYLERQKNINCVDSELIKQFQNERTYWRYVLEFSINVIIFLTSRGLPLRGSSEKFGENSNGNYLGLLELISKHNPFLKEHIQKYGNAGSGVPSYLSTSIAGELVEILARKVLHLIISELKTGKYYSISVDSTPDRSHKDQLTFIVRYVLNGKVVERFIQFIEIFGHDGEHLCNVVVSLLNEYQICLADCRGQSYDNAPNMSGDFRNRFFFGG